MTYRPHVGARQTLRASATAISTSFDSSPTEVLVQSWNQVTLLCTLSLATATSVEIEVDFASPAQGPNGAEIAPVAADWFTRVYTDTAAATASTGIMVVPTRKIQFSLVASGSYEIPIPVMARYMRVRAKTTGGPGATTLSIIGVQGLA